jgi:ribosome-associated toxin RatA of RatAB toxin-antitoxin module
MLSKVMNPYLAKSVMRSGDSEPTPKRATRPAAVWRRLRWLWVLPLFAVSAAAAAAMIHVTAQRHGEEIDIEARALLHADATTAWRVLTDYERYPEFLPDLQASRVVGRSGSTVRVEESGEAWVWLLRMPLDLTFEITESPPFELRSRAVAGSMHGLESRYSLVPVAADIELHYSGHVTPGFVLFGAIEEYAVRQNVTRQFQALVDEIERRGAPAATPAVAGARP